MAQTHDARHDQTLDELLSEGEAIKAAVRDVQERFRRSGDDDGSILEEMEAIEARYQHLEARIDELIASA